MKTLKLPLTFCLAFALVSLSACNTGAPATSTATAPPVAIPTETMAQPTATSAATETALPSPTQASTEQASGACQFTAGESVTIYSRPATSADVFSTQGAGFSTQITAKTADGWLGFEPGVAQAANIGPFRLRWIPPDAGTTSGDCDSLPVVWAPPPGVCFDMPMESTPVYASPDASSQVLTTLEVEQFAAVLGLTETQDWAQVDLSQGNTGLAVTGWVDATTLNMNGPCDNLPTVTP